MENNEAVQSQFIFRDPFTNEMHNNWLTEKVYRGLVIQYIIEVDCEAIGSIYLRDIDLRNESGEFGIFIGEVKNKGKGFGGLATRVFIDYCFSLGFHRIYARILDSNIISKEMHRKAGFEIEGVARDMVYIAGTRHDVVFMSMINQYRV